MSSSNNWISRDNAKVFEDISAINNIHPAIQSLCTAVSNLQHVHPTSMSQKACMVSALYSICRAINDIADNPCNYATVRLETPMDRIGDLLCKEVENQ